MTTARTVTVLYRRSTGQQLEYEITANENGTYWIRHPGDPTILRQGADPLVMHRQRGGGPERLEEAVATAKADIEALRGLLRE